MDETNIYHFEVTGGFNVKNDLKPELSTHTGNLTRFKLPDGKYVSLIVALEVMDSDEGDISYITSETEMNNLGFEGLDYKELRFLEEEE